MQSIFNNTEESEEIMFFDLVTCKTKFHPIFIQDRVLQPEECSSER